MLRASLTRATFTSRLLLLAAATLALAIPVGLGMGELFTQSDATHYLQLAHGQPAMMPFASRQLAPLLARAMHLGPERGFLILGVLSLAVFASTVTYLLLRAGVQNWTLPAVLGLFFWARTFNGLVLPDLPYAALVAVLLLLLWRKHYLLAALMLFPLALARESTALLLVCLLLACWRIFSTQVKLTAALSTVAGITLAAHLAGGGLGNQEHISPLLYLFAKMPWNILKNFLGLNPWANVYPACEVPVWQHALHLGPLRAVGTCGFEAWLPIRLASRALSCFGLLPLLLAWCWRRKPAEEDAMLRFALLYGLVSFAIAGALGDKVERLLGYGWPAFLVATPLLATRAGGFRTQAAAYAFVALHLALSWAAWPLAGAPLLYTGIAGWIIGWMLLRFSWPNHAQAA